MNKTITFAIEVHVLTDRRPRMVRGIRPEFAEGYSIVYEDSLLAGTGYLDAPEQLPAGSCYKVFSSGVSHRVYDSVTESRYWW